MPPLSDLIFPITVVFAAAGALVLAVTVKASKRHGVSRGAVFRDRDTFEMRCTVCQRTLVISPQEVCIITSAETALIVSTTPEVRGRKLGEYRCPHCDTSHCFAIDSKPFEWIVANAYEPQIQTSHCSACHTPLRNPTFPKDSHGDAPVNVEELLPDHGLQCSRCESVSCVRCAREFTRNRTSDGSMLCPRCGRGPLDTVFHL